MVGIITTVTVVMVDTEYSEPEERPKSLHQEIQVLVYTLCNHSNSSDSDTEYAGPERSWEPLNNCVYNSFSNGTPKTKPCLVKRMSDEMSSPPSGCEAARQMSPVAKNKLQRSLSSGNNNKFTS